MAKEAPAVAVNDGKPVGKITELSGEATIIHADGTHTPVTTGASVFQGDVIETSKTGAVNILFTDNTSFAISENAKLSIDQYVFNPAEQTGSTFFSMLQGVFVYTSGLIGKSDPGSVNIDTPVGSIGIRGTVIAGHIYPDGQESRITILDGAITFTNGSGTQELNSSFETLTLSDYQSQPVSTQMTSQTFSATYDSLSSVAGDALSHYSATAAPAVAPSESTEPEAEKSAISPQENTAPDSSNEVPNIPPRDMEPEAGPHMHMNMNIMPGQMPGVVIGTMMPGMYKTTILPMAGDFMVKPPLSGETYDAMTGTMTIIQPAYLPPPPYMPPLDGTNTTGSSVFSLGFNFMPSYTRLTPDTSDDGIKEFSPIGLIIGKVNPFNFTSDVTYSIAVREVDGVNNPAMHYVPPAGGAAGAYTLQAAPLNSIFSINGNGEIAVNDPLAMFHSANPSGFFITITATSGTNTAVIERYLSIPDIMPGVTPTISSASINAPTTFAADFMINTGNNATGIINGRGGADILIGGEGSNKIIVSDNTFRFIDGGNGAALDTLQLQNSTGGVAMDFSMIAGEVKNIEKIDLGLSGGINGSDIALNIQDVFEMTDQAHNHTLYVLANTSALNSSVYVTTSGANDFQLASGSLSSTPANLTYTGTYNGQNVTLVIQNAMNTSPGTGSIQVTET